MSSLDYNGRCLRQVLSWEAMYMSLIFCGFRIQSFPRRFRGLHWSKGKLRCNGLILFDQTYFSLRFVGTLSQAYPILSKFLFFFRKRIEGSTRLKKIAESKNTLSCPKKLICLNPWVFHAYVGCLIWKC